jgi:hypothetical protein
VQRADKSMNLQVTVAQRPKSQARPMPHPDIDGRNGG